MAITDKTPLKGIFNNGDAYALGEFSDTDTMSPEDVDYDPIGNNNLDSTTLVGTLDQIETEFTIYDVPQTISQVPYFQVYNSLEQSIASWHLDTIDYDTVLYDTENGFDTTFHKYTIPTKGIWKLQASVRTLSKEMYQNHIQFELDPLSTIERAGGSAFYPGTTDVYGSMLSLSGYADLNVGDIIFVMINGTASTQTLAAGSIYSSFAGHLLRAT